MDRRRVQGSPDWKGRGPDFADCPTRLQRPHDRLDFLLFAFDLALAGDRDEVEDPSAWVAVGD